MNTEMPQIIINSENAPNLPSSTTMNNADVPVEIYDVLRKFQPLGIRVEVKTPFIGDDTQPLFAIKCDPYQQVDMTGPNIVPIYSPIYPMPGTEDMNVYNPSVVATIYDYPPPIAYAVAGHRFWRGSLLYHMRVVSTFITQGYLRIGIIKGQCATEINTSGEAFGTGLRENHRIVTGCHTGNRDAMAHAFQRIDMSMFRHADIVVPYDHALPFRDTDRELKELAWANTALEPQITKNVICKSDTDTFIVVYPCGPISSGAEGSFINFEFEIAAGPDFELSTEVFQSQGVARNLLQLPTSIYPYMYPFGSKPPEKKKVSTFGSRTNLCVLADGVDV